MEHQLTGSQPFISFSRLAELQVRKMKKEENINNFYLITLRNAIIMKSLLHCSKKDKKPELFLLF